MRSHSPHTRRPGLLIRPKIAQGRGMGVRQGQGRSFRAGWLWRGCKSHHNTSRTSDSLVATTNPPKLRRAPQGQELSTPLCPRCIRREGRQQPGHPPGRPAALPAAISMLFQQKHTLHFTGTSRKRVTSISGGAGGGWVLTQGVCGAVRGAWSQPQGAAALGGGGGAMEPAPTEGLQPHGSRSLAVPLLTRSCSSCG